MRLALALSLLVSTGGCSANHLTDNQMIADFEEHKVEFNALVGYATSDCDNGVVRIDKGSVSPRIPELHRAAYEHAFTNLGISSVKPYRNPVSGSRSISFTRTAVGIAGSGSLKEWVWASDQPKVIVKQLDAPLPREGYVTKTWFNAYRHIEGNWFLHHSADQLDTR